MCDYFIQGTISIVITEKQQLRVVPRSGFLAPDKSDPAPDKTKQAIAFPTPESGGVNAQLLTLDKDGKYFELSAAPIFSKQCCENVLVQIAASQKIVELIIKPIGSGTDNKWEVTGFTFPVA